MAKDDAYDIIPYNNISYRAWRGTPSASAYNWPDNGHDIDPDKPMQKFRNYTGLKLDFPTEAQWEYACRAGISGPYNNGASTGSDDGSDETLFEKCASTGFAAKKLKETFPKVPLMTTARDPNYGVGTILSDIDVFVPLTRWYNPEKAAKARAAGHQVWWYVADAPEGEFANMNLENEPLDARSLMGAQTAKFRPDGFLIWQISLWNSSRPLSGGPFTDWDARSFLTAWYGCGCWVVCGPDGTPVPTLRLENFRDGLEDFAYVKILEEKLKAVREEDVTEWSRRARELVSVPSWVCAERDNFSTDPAVIYAWRDAIADLIEAMP